MRHFSSCTSKEGDGFRIFAGGLILDTSRPVGWISLRLLENGSGTTRCLVGGRFRFIYSLAFASSLRTPLFYPSLMGIFPIFKLTFCFCIPMLSCLCHSKGGGLLENCLV